jgi:hypothetical protein
VSGGIAIWDRPNGRKRRERLEQGGMKHPVVANPRTEERPRLRPLPALPYDCAVVRPIAANAA